MSPKCFTTAILVLLSASMQTYCNLVVCDLEWVTVTLGYMFWIFTEVIAALSGCFKVGATCVRIHTTHSGSNCTACLDDTLRWQNTDQNIHNHSLLLLFPHPTPSQSWKILTQNAHAPKLCCCTYLAHRLIHPSDRKYPKERYWDRLLLRSLTRRSLSSISKLSPHIRGMVSRQSSESSSSDPPAKGLWGGKGNRKEMITYTYYIHLATTVKSGV